MVTRYDNDPFPMVDKNGSKCGLRYYRYSFGGDYNSGVRMQRISINTQGVVIQKFQSEIADLKRKLSVRRLARTTRVQIRSQIRAAQSNLRAAMTTVRTMKSDLRASILAAKHARRMEFHDYTCTIMSQRYPRGDYKYSWGNWGDTDVSIRSTFGYPAVLPSVWDANDDISLINKLRGELAQGLQFHAGQAIAEIDETARLIAGAAKKISRSLRQLSRGNVPGALRVLANTSNSSSYVGTTGKTTRSKSTGGNVYSRKTNGVMYIVAKDYLLWQFAVKPLLDDVVNAAKALAWSVQRPQVRRFSVRRRKSGTNSFSDEYLSTSASRTVKKQIICYMEHNVASADILGLSDVPSIIYERIPFSFIADWFVPIGNFLSALQVSRMLASAKTIITEKIVEKQFPIKGGPRLSITYDGPCTDYTMFLTRRVGTGLPDIEMPVMKPLLHPNQEVSVRHALEAVSLLVLFGSKKMDKNAIYGWRVYV